ncbi:MAG: heme ABC transporter permease [Gammaproteobacteria bacterium]|nr:heme ABC transporter permease [Gammaproteobacteria bacterium]MCP5135638.1 heme ABC transporter permease [Gammaproteobacteria bacterium]
MSGRWAPWMAALFFLTFIPGLYYSLIGSPPDYQQGESARIMYIHVPAAWMSMFIYGVMALAGAITLIWKMKMADIVAQVSAPIGASFTFLALVTGSLWGKPMWGAYWVWDARLTSELILLFLFLGYIALTTSIDDKRTAARAGAVLALVGVVNLPIIHYSVEWWSTLHQPSTVKVMGKSAIHLSMLIPLLLMSFAFKFYYAWVVLSSARAEVLDRDKNAKWAADVAQAQAGEMPS